MEPLLDDLCKFTLLYVENDLDSMELVGRMLYLRYPNVNVLFAQNEADALAKAKKHQPDIYLIDTDVVGDELIEHIGRNKENQIIAIFNNDFTIYDNNCEITERCLTMGVADYITKPVDMDALLPKLNTILEVLFWKRLNATRGFKSKWRNVDVDTTNGNRR